jgi:hypothetical protein
LSAPASFRGGDDHLLHAAHEVALKLLRFQELAGAFQHYIAAKIAPHNAIRRRRSGEADAPVGDVNDSIVLRTKLLAPATVNAIEFQQMGGGRGAALDLVHMHDFEAVVGARVVFRPVNATHRCP